MISGYGRCSIAANRWDGARHYEPSKSWACGGPIIDREQISIWRHDGHSPDDATVWFAALGGIHGWDDGSIVSDAQSGETALVAAMRAYVASKFGFEVNDYK
jgi:hypothetical protein